MVEINDADFVEARTPNPLLTSPPPFPLGTEAVGAAVEDAVTLIYRDSIFTPAPPGVTQEKQSSGILQIEILGPYQ